MAAESNHLVARNGRHSKAHHITNDQGYRRLRGGDAADTAGGDDQKHVIIDPAAKSRRSQGGVGLAELMRMTVNVDLRRVARE